MSAALCLHILGYWASDCESEVWGGIRDTPPCLMFNPMGAMVPISAIYSMRLFQAWTGRAGGNYRHSASHLPEELRLQNAPSLLTLDWAQMGSKQERHSAEGTWSPCFNTYTHCVFILHTHLYALNRVLMCTPPYRVYAYTGNKSEREGQFIKLELQTKKKKRKSHKFKNWQKKSHSCIQPHIYRKRCLLYFGPYLQKT